MDSVLQFEFSFKISILAYYVFIIKFDCLEYPYIGSKIFSFEENYGFNEL
jgi:hypothetical protein